MVAKKRTPPRQGGVAKAVRCEEDDLLKTSREEAQVDSNLLALPEPLGRGTRNAQKRTQYEAEVKAWCERLIEFKPGIDFDPGVRGWCYLLEPHGLPKSDFDRAERLITSCRKNGLLPLDFTKDDTERPFSNIEELDDYSPEYEAQRIFNYVEGAQQYYDPVSFWEFQEHYVEMVVEKAALHSLFDPVCARYRVALGNTRGSWSLNMRTAVLRRLAKWQGRGKKCVLLNCGDHDPHGLRMSSALRSNLEDVLPALNLTYGETVDLEEIQITRFGLNADFIEEHALTWIENLLTGGGQDLADPEHGHNGHHDVQVYIGRFGRRKVEAEALVIRPEAGRSLCESAILAYVDLDGIERFRQTVTHKRQDMRSHLDRLLARARP
jgi:hypothetical protein